MPTLVEIINQVLDDERRDRSLPNDNELARHLDVAPKTVSLWRHNKGLCKAAKALVPLAYKAQPPIPPDQQ